MIGLRKFGVISFFFKYCKFCHWKLAGVGGKSYQGSKIQILKQYAVSAIVNCQFCSSYRHNLRTKKIFF